MIYGFVEAVDVTTASIQASLGRSQVNISSLKIVPWAADLKVDVLMGGITYFEESRTRRPLHQQLRL